MRAMDLPSSNPLGIERFQNGIRNKRHGTTKYKYLLNC